MHRTWWERRGYLLLFAFFAAQLVATSIAVYADWEFCRIQVIGWAWATATAPAAASTVADSSKPANGGADGPG